MLLPETAESMGFDTSEFDVNDLVTFLQSLDRSRRKLLSEIYTLGKLLLVMPPTSAVSERSVVFSFEAGEDVFAFNNERL